MGRVDARCRSRGRAVVLAVVLAFAWSSGCAAYASRVVVFGGSGFVGRRVCDALVNCGCEVISVSRSGRPPPRDDDDDRADRVRWIARDLLDDDDDGAPLVLPADVDACVSCVGDVDPEPTWNDLFGLHFDDDRLRRDNGEVNERAFESARAAGARRAVLVSPSYENAKAWEGAIEGYLDGKRAAERAACRAFGEDRVVAVGPPLVYGGKRFPNLGRAYRAFVTSAPARSYTGLNDRLRSLSSATGVEDWVERAIFSPPVDVDDVAKTIALGALGLITREDVGPRRQGFFGLDGKPVVYDDLLFVDGTEAIERLANSVPLPIVPPEEKVDVVESLSDDAVVAPEPPFEGALVGKRPFLYPLPVIALGGLIILGLVTGKFDEVNRYYYEANLGL